MQSNPNPHPPVINLEEKQSNSPAQLQEAIRHVDPIKFPRLASILMPKNYPSEPIEIENNIEPPAIKDVSPIQEQLPEVEQIQVSKQSEGISVPDIKEEFRRRCEEVEKEKERQIKKQFQNQKDFNQLKQAGEEDKFQQPMISSVVASIPMQDHLHNFPPQSSNEQITPNFNEIEVRIDPGQAALPTIQIAIEGQLQAIPEHFEEQPSSLQPQRQLGVQAEQNRMETQERKMSTNLMEPVASEPKSMVVQKQYSDNRSENLQVEALFTSRARSLCEYPRNQSLSYKNEISVKGSVDIDRDIVKPLIEVPNEEIPNSAREEQVQVSEEKHLKSQQIPEVIVAEENPEVVQIHEIHLVQAPKQPTFIPITAQPIIHVFDKQSVEVEEKQNEVRKIEPPVDDTPIIERVQPSEKKQMEEKVEKKPKWKRLFGSIECVRAFLLQKFPEHKTMVETLKEEELQPLLDQFQSSANQCLKTKQPSIESIRSQCIAMFPHLSKKILAKTPEEILELYKQSKRESSSPTKESTASVSDQKIVNIKPDSNQKAETPLPHTDRNPSKHPEGHGKRTYHEMLETKPQKESSAKKNKVFVSQIRRFLIEKLPTLKDKIKKLSDIDLANVFKQTVQTKKKSENDIIAGDSKTKSTDHISGSAIKRVNKAVPEDKVHIFEGVDERGQEGTKKIATVHTEVDMSLNECQGEEASLKRINGPKGVELKCVCAYCNRMNNMNDQLSCLASIIEQKK